MRFLSWPVLFSVYLGAGMNTIYVAFVAAVIFVVVASYYFMRAENRLETTGIMRVMGVETVYGQGKSNDYKVIVEYAYQVDGRKYTGRRYSSIPLVPNIVANKRMVDQLVDSYAVGKEVTAYYNPQNPGQAALQVFKGGLKGRIVVVAVLMFVLVLMMPALYFL